MKSKITYNTLKKKAANLSFFLPYDLVVERDTKSVWLVADYGMQGSDVLIVGTVEECYLYIDDLEKDYI